MTNTYEGGISVVDPTSATLDADLRAIFREKLEVELQALTSPRGERTVSGTAPGTTSIADVSAQQALDLERDVESALDSRTQETVDAIQDALTRLDDGTFGTCSDCGSSLPVRRLMALPYAPRCLECQTAFERRR